MQISCTQSHKVEVKLKLKVKKSGSKISYRPVKTTPAELELGLGGKYGV